MSSSPQAHPEGGGPMIGALGGAKALWPAGALATAAIAANGGWDGLVAVVREAGVGVALLYIALRFGAPWVAQTLEGQRARAQKAEDAAEARVEQLEREAHDQRGVVGGVMQHVHEGGYRRAGERRPAQKRHLRSPGVLLAERWHLKRPELTYTLAEYGSFNVYISDRGPV